MMDLHFIDRSRALLFGANSISSGKSLTRKERSEKLEKSRSGSTLDVLNLKTFFALVQSALSFTVRRSSEFISMFFLHL